jgi:hypothetical protein
MMTSSPPDFFTGDPLFSKIVFPSPPPSLAQLAIVEYGGCLQQKQLEK